MKGDLNVGQKNMKQKLLTLLISIVVASAHGATNRPPEVVTQFAAKPENKKPHISQMTGSRITLQGKEHGGYLNWLVVRTPETNEVRSVLLDDPSKGNHERLPNDELKELEQWFVKNTTEWTGSYKDKPLFRKLILPGWGGLKTHEEWQKGYISFRSLKRVWVVTCDHPAKVKGPGDYVVSSTTYFDSEGNVFCTVPHVLHVD